MGPWSTQKYQLRHNCMVHLISIAPPLRHLASAFSYTRNHWCGELGHHMQLMDGTWAQPCNCINVIQSGARKHTCNTFATLSHGSWLMYPYQMHLQLITSLLPGLQDITQVLGHPAKHAPFAPLATNQVDALEQLMTATAATSPGPNQLPNMLKNQPRRCQH